MINDRMQLGCRARDCVIHTLASIGADTDVYDAIALAKLDHCGTIALMLYNANKFFVGYGNLIQGEFG